MPRGVYPRTPDQLRAAKANLAKGRQPDVRAKAAATLKAIAQDPAWREMVSANTRKAMHRPEVREPLLHKLPRRMTQSSGSKRADSPRRGKRAARACPRDHADEAQAAV